ncbi:hypothetical protein RB213_014783 [Colletotrichum asianum]
MLFHIIAVLFAAVAAAAPSLTLTARADPNWGTICGDNAECGSVFDGPGCAGDPVHHITPDCSQTCIKVTDYPIGSVRAEGNWAYGTTCYMYDDENCMNEIG